MSTRRTVTVLITNTYACEHSSESVETADAPLYDDDLDDWWNEDVQPLTGDGHSCGPHEHASYEAKVTAVSAPEVDGELVGQSYTWEG